MHSGDLLGHYRLIHRVGSGGMGEVYLAEDTRINRQVAIKVVRTETEPFSDPVTTQETVRRFKREMQAVTMLDHPHILSLLDFGEEKDGNIILTYMVMPYRQEGSLIDWLRKGGRSEELTPNDVSYFIMQAADALQHAHDRDLIHQDVKPSNFLVRRRSGNLLPDLLLTDFGIAKITTATVTASRSIRGTPAYMAPEQWRGQPGPATDQYALAIMAYLLLTRCTPFSGSMEQVMHQHFVHLPKLPSSFNPAISRALDAVILRALDKQPTKRFPSILEFAQAFQRAAQSSGNDDLTVIAPKNLPGLYPTLPSTPLNKTVPSNPLPSTPLNRTVPSNPLPSTPLNETVPSNPLPSTPLNGTVPSNPPPSTPLNETVPSAPPFNTHLFVQTPTVRSGEMGSSSPDWGIPIPPPPPSVSQSPSSTKKSGWRLPALVALTILVILSSVVGVGVSIYRNQTNVNTPATTTSQADQQVNATATAQAIANNPYPSYLPGNGPLAFVDPLSQEGRWHPSSDEKPHEVCDFNGSALHAIEYDNQHFMHCPADGTYGNFAFEVQLTIVQGDCGGITFRGDSHLIHYYYFEICQDGTFRLRKYVDNNSPSTLMSSGNSPAIHTGLGVQNTLAMVVSGGIMTCYANEHQIHQDQDSSYSSGSIELVASPNYGTGNTTEVVYTNARLWTLA